MGVALSSMDYRVVITEPADQNFRDHFEWIRERSIQGAENWRAKMIEAVLSLAKDPRRNALAREASAFPVPIHCLLVGKQRGLFRILYSIEDDEVRVLAIRRPAQDFLKPDDLDEG